MRAAAGERFVTFDAAANGRDNNLNLLRMIAAATVLFSHSYPLSGHIADEPMAIATGRTDSATLGVIVFFAISGFLIAQSLTRNASLYAYAVNRALRILPGLALATVFCVAVGWLVTTLPSAAYWRDAATWRYLVGTPLLMIGVSLPGVFATNPYPHAVNGSLWTIPLEVWCYAAAALVAVSRLLRSRLLFTVFAASMLVAFAYFPSAIAALNTAADNAISMRLAGTFLFGAWIYVVRPFIPVSIVLAISALVAMEVFKQTRFGSYAFYAAIAYAALVFAYHPRLQIRSYLKLGDFSYGTYVLAFPVQQLIVWWLGITQPLVLFAVAFVATVALAALSWYFVEAPALARKQRWGAWRPRLLLRWRIGASP
jgi:peptidoglycan/LPS O-acetylase OafA/YrhL